jgi:hypothetical protein
VQSRVVVQDLDSLIVCSIITNVQSSVKVECARVLVCCALVHECETVKRRYAHSAMLCLSAVKRR